MAAVNARCGDCLSDDVEFEHCWSCGGPDVEIRPGSPDCCVETSITAQVDERALRKLAGVLDRGDGTGYELAQLAHVAASELHYAKGRIEWLEQAQSENRLVLRAPRGRRRRKQRT